MSVIDATVFFRARLRRKREPAPPTYETVLLRDLTVPELIAALRDTGIAVTKVNGHAILHRLPTKPPAA